MTRRETIEILERLREARRSRRYGPRDTELLTDVMLETLLRRLSRRRAPAEPPRPEDR